jgi:hypothetical protein
MTRVLALLACLALAACSGAPSHELAQTDKNDPTWPLNEGKWAFQDNALIAPPPAPSEVTPHNARVPLP